MNEYVTQEQHNEFSNTMLANFSRLDAEDKRLSERLRIVEDWSQKFAQMQVTLKQQGDTLEAMALKLDNLLEKPAKTIDTAKAAVITGIITGIIGLLIGYLF